MRNVLNFLGSSRSCTQRLMGRCTCLPRAAACILAPVFPRMCGRQQKHACNVIHRNGNHVTRIRRFFYVDNFIIKVFNRNYVVLLREEVENCTTFSECEITYCTPTPPTSQQRLVTAVSRKKCRTFNVFNSQISLTEP